MILRKREYSVNKKKEAVIRLVWRISFGKGYRALIRQTTEVDG
jgi:hypothetical protein